MALRESPGPPTGRGDGTITDDGCPVEIYAAQPPGGEAEIIHGALPAGTSVLELGCGTGRIADRVAALGHHVVGVDSSAAILTHLRLAQGVHRRIETLDLGERFDAVVLASHLVNTYDPAQRRQFLATARRHLRPGEPLIVQCYPAGYRPSSGLSWTAGPVELELRDVVEHGDGVFSATLMHRYANLTAEQDFSARILTSDALREALASAGFDLCQPPRCRRAVGPGHGEVLNARLARSAYAPSPGLRVGP